MREALVETIARLSEFLSIDAREAAGEEFRQRVELALAKGRRALGATGPRMIEGFLSRKAQEVWPRSLVYSQPSSDEDARPFYNLEVDDDAAEDLDGSRYQQLGRSFQEARDSVYALRRAFNARG